jgi:hypothetical protein
MISNESCDDDDICPKLIRYKCLDTTNDVYIPVNNLCYLYIPIINNTKCDQIVDKSSIPNNVEYCELPGTNLLNNIQISINGNIIEEDHIN